jgi:hypothetical protein
MSGGVDEHGRPISPDGFYVWDGTQWLQRVQQPAAPVRQLSPDGRYEWNGHQWVAVSVVPVHAQPVASGDDGVEAEAETYGGMWRLSRPAVLEVRQHLEPGERVLASAAGSGELLVPAGVAAVALLVTVAATAKRAMIVFATDRRLLLAPLTVTSRSIQAVQGIPYEQVESWKPRKRDIEITAAGGIRAFPHQMQKDKLPQLRAVVEPRLRPGVVQA